VFAGPAVALPMRVRGGTNWHAIDRERVVEATALAVALIVGLLTAADYGTTVDEFNTEPYGWQALSWYVSGFSDRSLFENAEIIHLYGPWFQILTALVQSLGLADPLTVRHALTFTVGIAGLAALGPLARLTIGRWAGVAAILLCLTTGYLYGHLFFSPIDVPFLAAMTWATLAIVVMAKQTMPSWSATIATGLALGLAMGTRPGGAMAQVYLLGAMALCAIEVLTAQGRSATALLWSLAGRTLAALVVAWTFAIVIWPWLQIGNPLTQFWQAFTVFTHMTMSFEFQHWGAEVSTADLPWHYIPGQLVARLPEPFLAFLLLSIGIGAVGAVRFVSRAVHRFRADRVAGLRAPLLLLARNRGLIVVAVAALTPAMFIVALDSTIYDGVRHLLFTLPLLALLASASLLYLAPLWRRMSVASLAATALYLGGSISTLAALHPLEYVAMNHALAGGTSGAYGRFELDYWSAAATEAIRRLEQRLDDPAYGATLTHPPKVMVCIGWREQMVAPLFRRAWQLVTVQSEADFIIETERAPCAAETTAKLIDEVKRFDRSFARTYARNRQ
jgi:hypothetical protein